MLFSIFINDKLYYFKNEISILDACISIGIKLPRFCYHESLSIAGNCRMCLVEVEKAPKLIIACSTEIVDSMHVFTNSPAVLKARENILEFLLLNHPLDCPICDQAGECDLQDQAIFFGSMFNRNYFLKRSVEDKNCGTLIKMIMNRCIHCTRCVRFGEEICGIKFFGMLGRGLNSELSSYILKILISEVSVNVVDICPVGALTLKTQSFQARPWELDSIESIDLTDCIGSNLYLLYKNLDIFKVVPKKNILINDIWISNKARYYFNYYFILNKKLSYDILQLNLNFEYFNLFLLNSDVDLNTFFFLKNLCYKTSKNAVKLLNGTALKKNFYFWGNKSKILNLTTESNGICFLIGTNVQIEAAILNIKLRHKAILNAFFFYNLGFFFKSNFPLKFTKFSIFEIIFLILGKHYILSQFFFKQNLLFFSSKLVFDRLDINLFNILNFNVPSNLFFNITSFCNSVSSNFLNFKKFNFKEYLFSKQIFNLNLDDSFFFRKLLSQNSHIFWCNTFAINALSFFSNIFWVFLENNQSTGLYLNIEQKVQKMYLIQNLPNKLHIFLSLILNKYILIYNSKIILYLKFSLFFFRFNYFIETYTIFNLHLKKKNFFSFFTFLFLFNFSFFFKNFLLKSGIEDPYRTSLQLKQCTPLYKSSQNLRQIDIL